MPDESPEVSNEENRYETQSHRGGTYLRIDYKSRCLFRPMCTWMLSQWLFVSTRRYACRATTFSWGQRCSWDILSRAVVVIGVVAGSSAMRVGVDVERLALTTQVGGIVQASRTVDDERGCLG